MQKFEFPLSCKVVEFVFLLQVRYHKSIRERALLER
jgi:hypothetical protein